MAKGDLFSIQHAVAVSCRCTMWFEADRLYGVVPGAAVRCQKHGLQTLVGTTPRRPPNPDPRRDGRAR